MRRSEIDSQNRYLLKLQHDYRLAADIVARAWAEFPEVQAIAVIGSVAKPLWKEVPRFREFRRSGIEVWHECGDLDMALWLDTQERLAELRKACARSLRQAFEAGAGMSVPDNRVDTFCSSREAIAISVASAATTSVPRANAIASRPVAVRFLSTRASPDLRPGPICWRRRDMRCSTSAASACCARLSTFRRSKRIEIGGSFGLQPLSGLARRRCQAS